MSHEGSNMKTADVGGGPVALSSDIPGNDTKDGDKIRKSKRDIQYRLRNKIKLDKWVFEGELLPHGDFPERKMAIKVLGESDYEVGLLHSHEEKVNKKRMVREAEYLLELIHHPNIVQYIHSCAEERDCIHILMELCDENTLEDRIRDLDNFSELRNSKYCKSILLHIAQAIHYMHTRNPPICHRDVKPSNILFSLDGKVVKISDFGYSKKVNPSTQTISSTKSTGTDTYRAPETYEDETQKTTNCSSDVFSLGIVYFFVLSKGKHPFGETPEEKKQNIAARYTMFLQGLTGSDGALARDVIESMLEQRQDDRPSTEDILKHPYFWSVQKIVSFYNRVVDQLEPPKKEKPDEKYKIETRRANVDDCIAEVLAKNRDLASHPYISENVEKQVHLFFTVAETIVGMKELAAKGNESKPHMQEVMETFKFLSSKPFIDNFKLAEPYIKIIARIPEALEKSKFDNTEDTEMDSDSSDESQNKLWAVNPQNKPGQTTQPIPSGENDDYSSDDLMPYDFGKIIGHPTVQLGEIPPSQMKHDSLETASKTVELVLQKGMDSDCILRGGIPSCHVIKSLISAVDDIRGEDDIIFEISEGEEPLPLTEACKRDNALSAPCSACTTFPLAYDFIPNDQRRAFNKAERHMTNAKRNRNKKGVIVNAKKLLQSYKKFKSISTSAIQKRSLQVKLPNPGQPLLKKLNELKFIRALDCEKEWQDLENYIDGLEKLGGDGIEGIVKRARNAVDQTITGRVQTWRECLEHCRSSHTQNCGNCPCVRLVKMSNKISGESVYDLIKFIRNKLIHFSAIKRSYEGDWIEQQEGILNFVAFALPELLPHMFKVMKEELKDFIDENQQLESSFYLPDIKKAALSPIETRTTVPESDEAIGNDGQADSSINSSSICDVEVTASEESYGEELALHFVTSTEDIGADGGRIAVGGCFVEFEPSTFSDVRRVSVSGTINRSTWPKGRDVITPTLHVGLGKIRKPATVRLSTWALRPDDAQSPKIEVLAFVDNKWEVVHTCALEDKRFIECKCVNLSRLVACLVDPNSQYFPRYFQPTLFFHQDFIVATVHLQDRILSQSLSQSLATQLNTKQDKEIQDCVTALKFNSEIDIRLRFRGSRDGVCPYPEQEFSVKIDRAMLSGAKFAKRIYGIPSVLKERQFEMSIDSGVREKVKRNSCTFAVPPESIPEYYRKHGGVTNVGAFEQYTRGTPPHDVMAGGGCSTSVKEVDTRSNVKYQGMEDQRIGNLAHNIRPSSNFEDSTSVNKAFSPSSIEVTVKFLDRSSTDYSSMYMLDQTIRDVVADIKKSAGKSIRLILSRGETLELDTTIADLVAKGYLKDLTAVVKE